MQHPHWDYYLTVLDDLDKASRFVEFARENFRTYSVEFVRIILSVGSEIDVVAKLLSEQIGSPRPPQNINEYREIILNRFPSFPAIEISAPKYNLTFIPWQAWQRNENPAWWTTYNKVKHARNAHYADACLENTLLSCSALCVLLGYLYAEFFANNTIPRPLLVFDDKYKHKPFVMTRTSFKLP